MGPDSLEYLDCRTSKITLFEKLPESLKTIYCAGNPIKSLDNLPNSLKYINFDKNNHELIERVKILYPHILTHKNDDFFVIHPKF